MGVPVEAPGCEILRPWARTWVEAPLLWPVQAAEIPRARLQVPPGGRGGGRGQSQQMTSQQSRL